MASTLLLVVVFVLDLIAFGLAVAAERRRNTATLRKYDRTHNYCVYDSDIATGLGAGAFLCLLVGQVLIMVASRCLCCGKALRSRGSRTWAILLFIVSWLFFFIAEVCLLAGSVRNAYHTKYYVLNVSSCRTLRKGVFGAGAAFILFTGMVSEFYYISYSRAQDSEPSYTRDTGLRMGNL